MKVSISFFLIVIFISIHSTTRAQKFEMGFRAGINNSSLIGRNIDHQKSNIGVHLGPVFKYKLNDRFFTQVELLFSTKGFWIRKDPEIFVERLYYLDMPIIGGCSFKEDKFRLLSGLQPSYLIHAMYFDHFLNKQGIGMDTKSGVNRNQLNKFDLGIITGFQYNLSKNFNVGFRCNYGLISIFNDSRKGHNLQFMLTLANVFLRK